MSHYAAGCRSRRVQRARAVLGVLSACSIVTSGCADADLALAPRVEHVSVTAAVAANQSDRAIPGQFIVTFRDDVSDVAGAAKQLVAQHNGQLGHVYSAALKGFSVRLSDQAAAALSKNPRIQRVEPDLVVEMHGGVQSNPPWNLDRLDQRTRPLNQSFVFAATGFGVNVYIIDSGIRATHSEFGGRVVGGYTAISDGNGTNDCNGHGTAVAGVAGGSTYGVAKQARLYAVRVLGCTGSGAMSALLSGIDWVTANRKLPAVANMSLGSTFSSTLNAAVAKSISAGVVYVVAAGNGSSDACGISPASVPAALTIGGANGSDAQADGSNYGKCLDLYAPGVGIRTAWYSDDITTAPASGTSFAAPHVAGAAALYLELNPAASPAAVADQIVGGATAGVLTALGPGSPDRLLFTGGGPSTSPDPTPLPPDTVKATPPAAPTALAPKVSSLTRVDLSWQDRSTNEDGFEVQRRLSSGDWASIAKLGANATNYSDTAVQSNQTYVYRVRAFNAGGTSSFSNEPTVTVSCTTKGKGKNAACG